MCVCVCVCVGVCGTSDVHTRVNICGGYLTLGQRGFAHIHTVSYLSNG